jgi:hypothetical protein
MVRDYLAGGFLETWHPMRYAEAYYERFPKVALGHYPPGFYLVASAGLIPFRSGSTLLVLMNFLSAGAGLLLWWFGRRLFAHDGPAIAIACLYVLLPQTRTYTAIVMADLLLVILGLLAARSFLLFLRSESARDSLFFGIWAAGAILTKGSGVGLALFPLFALLLSGKWRLFLSTRLWLAPIPVLVLALPWMYLTMGITGEGMQESGIFDWFKAALPFYGKAAVSELGWSGLGALGVAAGLGGFRIVSKRLPLLDAEAVLWALLACGVLLPLLVPAGLDNRYLMPVIPAVLLLGAAPISRLAGQKSAAVGALFITLFAMIVIGETFRPVQKLYTGATSVVNVILEQSGQGRPGNAPLRLLVVSNPTGEGALIAAAALTAPHSLSVARGTKMLSSSDWVGRDYRSRFETPQELMEILGKARVDYLVIDPPPAALPATHWETVSEWLEEGQLSLPLVRSVPSWRRQLESRFSIYRVE